eukprot:TRINITY_DN95181_c0_g1_i1.p1 TRINITY_DN95181_c0_g1~~TRINITY_DN95181_c0_g1_i1.p1  ORF type:complete len:142 (+),score=41.25 TRINITY_DN95181_c0_g1_i1:31-426(+)
MAAAAPTSSEAYFRDHGARFGAKDVDALIANEYTEDSILDLVDHRTGERNTFKGLAGIREAFTNLFAKIGDNMGTVEMPVVAPYETPFRGVFITWNCKAAGIISATDTFVLTEDYKVAFQSVVITTAEPKE